MALQQIGVGTSANDNTGDTLRAAFQKVNANTTDLLLSVTTSANSVFNGVQVGKGTLNVATNTIIGVNAGTTASGGNNLILGNNAGRVNTTGADNTFVGTAAGYTNIVGMNNSFFGSGAGQLNTADGNTFLGTSAGYNTSSGINNTFVGLNSGVANTIFFNSTCLGSGSTVSANNQVNLGNTSITTLRCNVTTITALSDARDKTDILEISEGLDFVSKLKPVSFTWNQRDGGRVGIKSTGFIAQDLLALQKNSLIGDNLDLVSDLDLERLEARYANLLPIMVKAIQELKAEIEILKAK